MRGNETGAQGAGDSAFDAEYEALAEPVKLTVTKREFAWLDPESRSRLQDDLCMPEPTED